MVHLFSDGPLLLREGWRGKAESYQTRSEGFEVLPKRWIVERTFSWLIRNRRLSKDYERRAQTSETLIEVAMIRLLLSFRFY
jgi:putative transposase